MESSSLRAFQTMLVTAANSGAAAPIALRRGNCCFVPPPQRWRPRAAQWQGRARGMDPQASPPPPVKLRPGTAAVRVVGAGVALALALGGVSWAWTARGGSACCRPVLQPALACVLLNDATDGGAPLKKTLDPFMDELSRAQRKKRISRDMAPKDRDKLIGGLEQQFRGNKKDEDGLHLSEAWFLLGNWREAKTICQELKKKNSHDPRPQLLSIVINMMEEMEAMLSMDPTTTDSDIDEVVSKINEITKNAIDAWKEYRKKSYKTVREAKPASC